MKKNLCFIFIIALALLAAGCSGAYGATENSAWKYRNNYIRDETVGLEDVGEVKYKRSKEYVSALPLPTSASPITDEEQKRKLDAEIDELTADISGGADTQTRRHSLAYAAFGIEEKAFEAAARIERNVYPAVSQGLEYTGLFLPAGETVTVTADGEFAGKGLKIVLNSGRPDLKRYEPYTRIPRLYCEYRLDNEVTYITHPFGGTVEIYVPAGLSGVKVNLKGCVKTGLYRLGIDSEAEFKDLKSNPTGVAVFDFGAGTAVIDRPLYERAADIDEALCWWNSVLLRAGGLFGSVKKVRLYSDCVSAVFPSRNVIVFPLSSGAQFLNASGLKSGGCMEIVSKLADLHGGVSGADGSSKSAAYYIIGQIEREFTHSRSTDSNLEASVALSAAANSSSEDFSLMTSAEKTALNVILWHFFGAEQVSELLQLTRHGEPYENAAARREAFALNACKLFQADLTPLFELFKFNLSEDSAKQIAALGYPVLFPLANKYSSGLKDNAVRNGYAVSGSSLSVDFETGTVDSLNAYELIGVTAGEGMRHISAFKYDVSLSEGETVQFELTYKERASGENVVLAGEFTRQSNCNPQYAAIDSGARGEQGLYLINPRSESFTHKGDWVCVENGAYAGGESLCGRKGAYLSFNAYAEKIVIVPQDDSARAAVKLRVDGGKYSVYSLGGESGSLALDGLTSGEHRVELKVTEGELLLKAVAADSALYALNLSDLSSLFTYSQAVYSDPYAGTAAVLWITFSLLFCAAAVIVLFAVVFPVINRKKGTDLPCLRLRLPAAKGGREGGGNEGDEFSGKPQTRRRESFKTASGEVCALDWDDNWVKEVALPPVTKAEKVKEKAVSPVLVADAPLLSEMEKASEFVRREAGTEIENPFTEKAAQERETAAAEKRLNAIQTPKQQRSPLPVVRAQLKPLGAKAQDNSVLESKSDKVSEVGGGQPLKPSGQAKTAAVSGGVKGGLTGGGKSFAAAETEKHTVIKTPALKAVPVIKRGDKEKTGGNER